jgi:hypothetical protein
MTSLSMSLSNKVGATDLSLSNSQLLSSSPSSPSRRSSDPRQQYIFALTTFHRGGVLTALDVIDSAFLMGVPMTASELRDLLLELSPLHHQPPARLPKCTKVTEEIFTLDPESLYAAMLLQQALVIKVRSPHAPRVSSGDALSPHLRARHAFRIALDQERSSQEEKPRPLMLLICGRSGQNLGLSGGDPPPVKPFARGPQSSLALVPARFMWPHSAACF